MKAMERAGSATLITPHTHGDHAGDSSGVRAAVLAWEDWFRQATLTEQGAALALAQRQGYVFAHQLPAPGNGGRTHTTPNDGLDRLRSLLAGKTDRLPPA